ncbi:MAG: hypothetical protein IJB12_06320 [Methanocorpusculum sp.]|nr:hypothetical protein [Methanocorpusculum sp.]
MTEKSGLTWYQDLIYSIFFFGSGFIAFYLTKDNQTPEVTSGVYIAGIVFGIVLTLIFVYIIRHKCLPVQEKTKKSDIARWLCFAGIIIVGIILALVFVKGIVIPAIWQIDTAFILGEVIGALIIVSLIHFEEIQHGAQWIVNRLTGKKSE